MEKDDRRPALRPWPLRSLLTLLVAVAMLPVLAASLYTVGRFVQADREEEQLRVLGLARSLAQSVDRQVAALVDLAATLARIDSTSVSALRNLHIKSASSVPPGTFAVLVDQAGEKIFSTRVGFGEAPSPGPVDAEVVRRIFAHGNPAVGEAFLEPSEQRWIFDIGVPVELRGEVRYALLLRAPVALIGEILLDQAKPTTWRAAIIDGSFTVVATAGPGGEEAGEQVMADLRERLRRSGGAITESTDADGARAVTASWGLPYSGWYAVVAAPRAMLEAPSRALYLRIGLLGMAALLLSFAAAALTTRLIERPIEAAVRAARQLGSGRSVSFTPARVAEANVLGHALVDAGRAVEERQKAVTEKEQRLRIATSAAELGVFEFLLSEQRAIWENDRMYAIFGRSRVEGPLDATTFLNRYVHRRDRPALLRTLSRAAVGGGDFTVTFRIWREGSSRWIEVAGRFDAAEGMPASRLVGVAADVTDRKLAELLLASQKRVLECLVSDATLNVCLDEIARVLDEQGRDAIGVILLACDPDPPQYVAAPGLTPEQLEALNTALAEGEDDGPFVRTVRERAPNVVPDLEGDGCWPGLKRLPRGHGLRSAWAVPIETSEGQVLGALGSFLRQVRSPYPRAYRVADVLADTAALAIERRRAEEQIMLLMREVNHRAKNLLAVVQAVARQTADSGDPKSFSERLSQRIAGLAASHDLLVKSEWQGVDMRELVRQQLAHFGDSLEIRITLDGPEVRLNAAGAQAIGMALHELATNAAKYGALSNASGHVTCRWSVDQGQGDGVFHVSWLESDGPPVLEPTRKGFGHTVMVRMVEFGLSAKVALDYRSEGLVWSAEAPVGRVLELGRRGFPRSADIARL